MQRVRLHQLPVQFHPIQELTQGRDLDAGVGGEGALGDRDAQRVGVETHLGNETRSAGGVFSDRAPQCLAVAHECVDGLSHARLSRHPLLEQGLESFYVELSEQQAEGGIRRRLVDVGAEQFVESLAVPLGETLHAQRRALAAQAGLDRHQQHPPLGEAHPTAHAAVEQRFEEADQIGCGTGVLEGRGQGCETRSRQKTVATASTPGLLGQTSNGPWQPHPSPRQEVGVRFQSTWLTTGS
jgi:hypothetical protein